MSEQFNNPMNYAVTSICDRIKDIKIRNKSDLFPSVIMYIAYSLSLLLSSVFWIYGWVSVLEQIFRFMIHDAIEKMSQDCEGYIDKVPLLFSMGIYAICWIPFALLSLPLLIIGWLADTFFKCDLPKRIFIIVVLVLTFLVVRFHKELDQWVREVRVWVSGLY